MFPGAFGLGLPLPLHGVPGGLAAPPPPPLQAGKGSKKAAAKVPPKVKKAWAVYAKAVVKAGEKHRGPPGWGGAGRGGAAPAGLPPPVPPMGPPPPLAVVPHAGGAGPPFMGGNGPLGYPGLGGAGLPAVLMAGGRGGAVAGGGAGYLGGNPMYGGAMAGVPPVPSPFAMLDTWIHCPVSPVDCQRVGLQHSSVLEICIHDFAGSITGTAMFEVGILYPCPQGGMYAEATFLGASDGAYCQLIGNDFRPGGAHGVLHLCPVVAAACTAMVHWPGRVVYHRDVIRLRDRRNLIGPWMRAPPSGMGMPNAIPGGAAAQSGLPRQEGAEPLAKSSLLSPPPAQQAVRDEERDVGSPPSPQPEIQSLRKEVNRPQRSGGMSLFIGDQEKKKKRLRSSSSDSSRSSQSNRLAATSHPIRALAPKHPVRLLQAGLRTMLKFMPDLAGLDGNFKKDCWGVFAKYYTTIWLPSKIKVDHSIAAELRTVCASLDSLMESPNINRDAELMKAGDVQMQRMKALERAHDDGHWNDDCSQDYLDIGSSLQSIIEEHDHNYDWAASTTCFGEMPRRQEK